MKDFYSHSAVDVTGFDFDQHHCFWRPLRSVHNRISSVLSHPNFPETEADPIIVQHISELFKSSASIYAERQMSPDLTPSAPQIRKWINSALCSLSAIPRSSGVHEFILWPLLIIGLECINTMNRDLVRSRVAVAVPGCVFGKFSWMDVLEKAWSLSDAGWTNNDFATHVHDSVPPLNALGVQSIRYRGTIAILENDDLIF
jgi:hypothetical protein